MAFIGNFIFGLIIAGIGIAAIKYNYQIVNTMGRLNWLENKLGPGTTYLAYQVFAVLTILFGFTMMISLHDNLLEFLLRPLTNLLNQQ